MRRKEQQIGRNHLVPHGFLRDGSGERVASWLPPLSVDDQGFRRFLQAEGWIKEEPISLDQYMKRVGMKDISGGTPVAPAQVLHEPSKPTTTKIPELSKTAPVSVPAPAATAPSSSVTEVPKEIIAKARASFAQQVGAAAADAARIVAAEEVTWPNGAIGCPQPGRMYTQALVPGYRVVFEAGGQTYAYHASRAGEFKHCKQPSAGVPPGGPQVR